MVVAPVAVRPLGLNFVVAWPVWFVLTVLLLGLMVFMLIFNSVVLWLFLLKCFP